MTRTEFMKELETLLFDLSKDERDEALQYYNDYLDDAGKENESDILEKLESPKKVSQTIHSGLSGDMETKGEYGETGYHDTSVEDKNLPAKNGTKKPWTSTPLKCILIILLVVVGLFKFFPMIATLSGIVLATAIVFFVFLALLLGGGFIVAGIGVLLFVFACFVLPGSFVGFLGLLGSGLLLIALGLSVSVLLWWCVLKLFPPAFRWLVNLIRKLFHREERKS